MIKKLGLLPHTGGKAKKLVVLLHGYGSQGEDLLSIAPYWSSLMPDAEFVAPNGPEACEVYKGGYQWFSLKELTPSCIRAGLTAVRPILRDYLREALLERDLTPGDLAVVGFSQGGMVALEMMFALAGLRGIICYSGGFYPLAEAPALSEPYPHILLVHGDADARAPYEAFKEAQRELKKLGLHPETLTCSGLGHSIDEEGIKAGGAFLAGLFG